MLSAFLRVLASGLGVKLYDMVQTLVLMAESES